MVDHWLWARIDDLQHRTAHDEILELAHSECSARSNARIFPGGLKVCDAQLSGKGIAATAMTTALRMVIVSEYDGT